MEILAITLVSSLYIICLALIFNRIVFPMGTKPWNR